MIIVICPWCNEKVFVKGNPRITNEREWAIDKLEQTGHLWGHAEEIVFEAQSA